MAVNPTDIRDEGLIVEHPLGAGGAPIRQSNLWKDAWRRYRRNRGAAGGTVCRCAGADQCPAPQSLGAKGAPAMAELLELDARVVQALGTAVMMP